MDYIKVGFDRLIKLRNVSTFNRLYENKFRQIDYVNISLDRFLIIISLKYNVSIKKITNMNKIMIFLILKRF